MPIDNTKLKQLYDTLKQGGYKKDYNNFRTKFLGNENYPYRQKVFNLLSENGEDYGSSYGEFMQRMQVAKPTAAASAAPKQPQQIDTLSTIQSARDTIFNPKAAVQPGGKVAQQAVKDEQTQDDAATKPFDVNQANAFVENMRLQNEAAQRQHQNVNGYLQQTAGQFGKNATRLGFKGQSNLGLPLAPKNQDGAFIDALGREYESETEARLAQKGAQHAREALTEANMQHNDPKNYLLEQKARIEKELNARSSQLEGATDRVPSFATGVAGNAMTQAAARLTDKLQDTKYKALTMQLDKVNQALDTLDEAEHAKASDQWIADSSNWIERAGKGVLSFGSATGRSFKRQASKLSNWDFGFSDLAGGLAIFDAVDKADKGGVEALSPEQRKMLDLYAYNNHIQGENKEHLGWGNTAGTVTAQALPFMLEMALNPASGVGKFAQRKAMQWAVKKYGKEKLKQIAKRYLLAKAGTRIAGDWLGAATMSATTGQARVAADAVQRRIGEVETDIDNFGRVTYGGHKNGVDWGEAFGKAFLSNTIENQTEMAGDYFGIIGKAFSKGGQKALDKIGLGFVNDFMRNVSSTKVAKAVTDFENATHWNGTTGEYLEEVLGNVENALMVGDSTFDTDKDTGVFNVDKNIETFLSVAVMGGFFSAVKTASYTAPKKRALNEMADIGRQIDGMLGNNNAALEQWGTWRNTFINGTDEEKKQTLREVMDNQQLPMGFRMAFLEYTKAAQKYHGIAQAEQKRAEEGTLDPIGQALDQAYEEGYGTTEPTERQMAYRRLNETRAKVAQLLELEEGEDLDEAMGNDPIGYIHTLEEQGFTPEQIQPVMDYANAQATYEGMMQQREDRANEQADAVKREVRQITHRQTGQIQKATLDGGERAVYVLNGKVVLYPDGTGVDKQESDDVLYVQDVQTGELFTIAPNRISELAEPTDPQAVIAEREEAIAAATNQEIEQEEGAASGTAAPTEAPEVRIPAPRFSGARVTLDLPNGSSVNGVVLQETDDGVEVQTDSPVNGRFVQVFPTDEFDGMLSSVRDEADDVIWSREVAGPVDVEEENQNDAAANGQQTETKNEKPTLSDVIATLYEKGKEYASSLFGMKFFDVAQTPQFMKDLGIRGSKFTIRYGVISRHWGKDNEHTLPREVWEQLPKAIQHPFAITKYYSDNEKKKQKGYRVYTSLQLSNGSFVVVSVEVKNAGRNIEVNAINTIFGRERISDVHDELIYTSETITPEQMALLNENNPHQYPSERESSESKDTSSSRSLQGNEGENAANGQQREMQGNGIPVDAKTGEPVYDAVAPDVAWDAIVQEAEGDEAMAMQVVTDMVADMEAKVQKAKKAKVRAGSSVREKLEAQKKHKRRIEEAEAQLEAWRRIAAVKAERIAAAERAKIEAAQQREVTQEDETEVPDFVFDKPENARERGYRMQNGQRADRQEPIAAAVGKEVSVKFTNKVSQPVRVAVVDARSLQPSHQNGQPNVLHFLPEAQPKKRTDHESVHAAEQIAAQMNPEEITSSVTAYTGAPSVNARGEVIQGNNRTAALKRMWQGYPEQAAAYKQYLMDHASEYGLNPEDIAAMEQPVLVNLMDVTDEQAIELGQYDVKDTESGGTERIKPRNVSQKMGDKAERFASILLRTTDEDASVSQLIDEHAVETLKWLEAQHYISPTQYRSAFNAEGEVTTEAKNDLRGILYQAVFKNGSERLEDMFNALPAKAQRAILATAYRDFSTPESEKMLPEIQNSIVAFYELSQDAAFANAKNFEEARKATMAWLQQMQFDFSTGQSVSREGKYTNFALTLAAMYKVQTQTAIQQTFNDMFDLLQGRQQPDLYNPNPNNTPRTLAEAIREVLNIEYDGTNGSHALGGNNETRTTGRQGSARDDSAGGTDAPGNAAADAEGGTVQTDNERGRQRNLRHTPRREKNNLSKTEELKFSEELDQNGHPFILSSDGTTVFGEITKNSGLTAAPIKLNEGFNKTDEEGNNIGYGLLHIQAGHGQQILEAGYPSVQKFVEDVCRNYKEIRIGRNRKSNQTYMLLELHDEKHKCTLYVELSHDGTYWNVNSGGIFRNKYTDKNDIVWPEPTVGSNANTDTAEVANNPTEVAKGETVDRGGNSSQPISSESKDTPQNSAVQTSGQENAETSLQSEVTRAEQQTNAEPTEGQKEAGNYKKGRVKVGPFDVVIEQPRGSVRSGVDANGKAWETTMQNTYGYFGGTKGVDGDAIDVFLGNDLDGWDGITVFVVDQYNPDGSFDEHKVMLGFNSQEEAEAAYFANYEADWAKTHRTEVTAVPLADFNEWVKSSKRKTKAFAEYKVAKRNAEIDAHNAQNEQLAEQLFSMAKEAETEKDFFDRAASLFEVTGYESDLRDIYNGVKSGEIANARALSFYTNATLKPIKEGVKVKAPKSEQKQKAEAPRQSGYERKHWHADSSLEEMLAREKYLQNAMSFGTKEMAEVFPMAEEWQRDREELKAKYGDDLKNALPNDVKNAFLKKHRNTFANQTALNDELYELRTAIIAHKEKAASRAEAAAKEQKAEEANKRFGDFLNGKTPLRRASIVKALTRVSNFGKEGSMTMAQFIEKHVAEGTLELRTKEVDKLQGPSRRQLNRMDASQQAQAENRVKQAGKKTEYLINGFVANKTAYEYAEHLLATKNGKAGEKPRKHAAQPGAPAVSTQEATLRDALVDVAQQSGLEVVVDEKAQQVLDEVNGRARTMAFGEEYDYDRYPEGRVEPNIADKYVHIERAKLDHGFANFNEAKEWAKSHIVRTLDNEESGGKGNVKISSTAVNKYLSESAVAKSDSKDVHLAVLKKLPEIIHDSVDVETTPDFKKDENGVRKVGNEINKNVLIHRCYGAVEINGNIYRVKITLKEYKDAVRDNKAYSYEATKIELLAGTLVGRDISSNPGTNNSISVAKLLKDVEMSYRPGVKVLEESAKQRARLREHRYFRTPSGEAYGFTVDGKIYLDPRIATAETPIHEYAHLWADMIRNVNAEAWNDIVGLMKATPIWEEVRGLYPELKTDDEIADEVLAHYSGRRGAERLREAQQQAATETGKSVFERAAAVAAIERVKQALAKFWQSVAELFHIRFTSAEEVADRVLADMLNGVNPNQYIKRKGKGVQKLHLNDKTLAGIHNITEEKLRKALNLGGLANPSLAIIDTAQNKHEDFGEISLIAPSALVDKETGQTAGTWTTDAYTQRYPEVERVMSEAGYKKFDKWVESLDLTDIEKAEVRRQTKEAFESNRELSWELIYLLEKGIDAHAYTSNAPYEWKQTLDAYSSADELLDGMQKDEELHKKVVNYVKGELSKPIKEKIRGQIRQQIKNETGTAPAILPPRYRKQVTEIFNRDYAKDLFGEDLMPGEEDVKKVMQHLFDLHNRTKHVDFSLSKSKASTDVHSHDLYSDYLRWQNKKLKEFGVKGRLFSGYSADGSRKYIPETLKNVSKAMVADANGQTNGGEMVSLGSFVAKFADRVDSADEMRANKKRLATNESKQGFYSEWMPTYKELADELSDDIFAGEQRLHDIAVQDNPVKYAKKEYGITLSKSFMDKLNAFKKAIREDMTSSYFETKFERPVYLNEFAAAVIPSDLSEDVKGGLEKSGIAIYEYDPKIEGDRDRATNAAFEADNRIRFQFVGQQGAAALDKAEEATTRLDNLGVAREMERQEKDAKAIKLATGWERGGDGKWRYEVQDFDVDVRGTARRNHLNERLPWGKEYDALLDKVYEGEPLTEAENARLDELMSLSEELQNTYEELETRYLDDYVKDRSLFDAYPELKQVRVEMFNDPTSGVGATWYNESKLIRINEAKLENNSLQSLLAHEVQHAIQHIEGFAMGGNSTTYREHLAGFREKYEAWSVIDEFEDKSKELGDDARPIDVYNALVREYQSLGLEFGDGFAPSREAFDKGFNLWTRGYDNEGYEDAYNEYQRLMGKFGSGEYNNRYDQLAGEVEARNVQKRLHMTPEERRQSLAEETEDVAREDQIFIMDGIESANSLGDKFEAFKGEEAIERLNAFFDIRPSDLPTLPAPINSLDAFKELFANPVRTVLGSLIKVKDRVFEKIARREREMVSGSMLSTLKDADFVIKDTDGSKLYVKRYKNAENEHIYNVTVVNKRDEVEDYISSVHIKSNNNLRNKIEKGAELLLPSKRTRYGEQAPSNSTPAAKVAEKSETSQLPEENNFREGKGELSDDMLSYLNDPMAQMMGKPRGTKKQRAQFAERERGRMQAHAQNLVERLHLPNVEIVTDASQLEGKQRTAKGFYNKRTGKITIVLPNHASTADVEQTLLHEAVAHYGLRQLFGEHFDDFLDMVYRNAEEGIRRKIAEASAKHGWNVRTATEEYLADLAERTDFEHASPQWWAKIKGFFLDMLRGLGFEAMDGQTLTDNELRYVLWRSYENLTEPGKYPTFIAEARDVAKQHALQVGRFAPTETAGSRVAENEALSEEEMSEILFRDGSTYNYTQVLARDRYERRIKSGMYQTQEALQDSMLGLRTAMESILEAEGRKGVYIEDIDGFENAYLGENRLSSVNQAEAEKFSREVFAPMLEEVSKLAPTADERAKLIDYLFAKHGLERNEVMARRAAAKEARKEFEKELRTAARAVSKDPLDQDAEDALDDVKQRMQEREDALYSENRQKTDYAGLTTLTGKAAVADAELMAHDMVDTYENAHDTNALWDAINTVTQGTLKKSFDTGMISRDTYDDIRSMYQFYIPLRGFDERTSNEEYSYLGGTESVFTSPIKTAKGRRSKADDPLAYMQMMAESAIAQGNRNQLVKQKLLNFALNHPSDLISVSELWLRRDPITDQWNVVQPGDLPGTDKLEDSDTAEMVSQKMEQFEQVMQQLKVQNPDDFVRQKDRPDIPYRVVNAREMQQHQVMVKRNGKTYVLTINGNPRAAQAVNGLTNPNNDMSGAIGVMARSVESANRWLSSVYTTRNPDFVLTNLARDAGYTNTMVWLKEDSSYAVNFNRNYATRANLVNMIRLYSRLMKGQLDLTDPTEMLFSQFISNGGETGYTAMRDLDAHKTKIKKELKKLSSDPSVRKVWNASFDMLDLFNKAAENSARFAAFITSREAGRTLDRSIYDAKEISVNFNKKGAGAKFLDSYGAQVKNDIRDLSWKNPNLLKLTKDVAIYQTVFSSGVGRSFFAFWNAAIQGSTNFGRVVKRHPKKALTAMAIMFALGLANAMVGASGDDDDDAEEGNGYFDHPSNTRRSNLMLRINGKSWASIPLPVEYRAVYGMGELLGSVMSGKERYTNQELAHEVLCQVSQVLPLDVIGEGSGAFVPTAVKPLYEVVTNESWTGLPIYKQTVYNERDPAYTKAYSNTNKQLVGMSKMLNELSGGDSQKSGWIDVNPAVVEHLGRGYLGGYFNLVDKLVKTGETVVGSREYDPSNLLIVNRFVKSGSERTAYRAINNRYYQIKADSEELIKDYKGYNYETKTGKRDYSQKIAQMNGSPELLSAMAAHEYITEVDKYNKALKSEQDEVLKKRMEKELYELKSAMIHTVDSILDHKQTLRKAE